jgi:hypothetical protein
VATLKAGETFLFPKAARRHLHIILTDPSLDRGRTMVVSVTTYHPLLPEMETGCLLREGDHPFINRPSTICWSKSQVGSIRNLEAAADAGEITIQAPISDPTVLLRILQGARLAAKLPDDCAAHLECVFAHLRGGR